MMTWLLLGFAWGAELRLDDVLTALDARLPAWAEGQAAVDGARAKALSASGVFDPKAFAKASQYVDPKVPRRLTDAGVDALTPLGVSVGAGHRSGVGDFPSYDGRYTSDQGEVYGEAALPLLDGLLWSEERVARELAQLAAEGKEEDFRAKQVMLARKATETYWKWVAAGAALEVERQQLELAEQRASMLTRQVDEGGRPLLDALDNERALYERREAWIAARQKLDVAAVELSLFWRDADGAPQQPTPDQLPSTWPELAGDHPPDEDLRRAATRPDVVAGEVVVDAAEQALRGARNTLLPELTLSGELARDVGLAQTEAIATVTVSSPLWLRKERGAAAAASADLRQAEEALRGLRDQARADVLAAHAVRDTARERLAATRAAAERASEVVELERRRFELGGGDLFQLLLRESNLAKARKSVVDAELDMRIAEAAVVAAAGSLPPSLGGPPSP